MWTVDLNGTTLGDLEIKGIASALACKAKYLHLNNCSVKDSGLRFLVTTLWSSRTVEWIDLRNNKISMEGASRFVFVIKPNDTLSTLHLDGNDFDVSITEELTSAFANVGHRVSPFRKWLKAPNQQPKATLTAEITFMQDIYMKAEDPLGTYNDPLVIRQQLETTTLLDRLDSSKGISVHWFLDVFCQTPFIQALVEQGCELWLLRKVGVNEILRRLGIRNGPMVEHVETLAKSLGCSCDHQDPLTKDTATVFVSYTGRFLLRHFVELLEDLRGEYMWVDMFCVDQFAWTGRKTSSQDVEPQTY